MLSCSKLLMTSFAR